MKKETTMAHGVEGWILQWRGEGKGRRSRLVTWQWGAQQMKANYFNFARPQELFVLFACLGWPWGQHEAQIFNAKRKVKRSFGGSHLRRVMSGVCWLRMLPLNSCSHSSHGSSRKMCSSLGGVIRDARSWAVSYIKSSKHTGKCRWKNKKRIWAYLMTLRSPQIANTRIPRVRTLCSDHLFSVSHSTESSIASRGCVYLYWWGSILTTISGRSDFNASSIVMYLWGLRVRNWQTCMKLNWEK